MEPAIFKPRLKFFKFGLDSKVRHPLRRLALVKGPSSTPRTDTGDVLCLWIAQARAALCDKDWLGDRVLQLGQAQRLRTVARIGKGTEICGRVD